MTDLQLVDFLCEDGSSAYGHWLRSVRDLQARCAIERRVLRLARGNPGDHRTLRHGVHELRIDVGPGYRVYYGRAGENLIILLGGGAKCSQDADIASALRRFAAWRRANGSEE